MLGSLQGTVIASSGQCLLIEVNNIGYWVHTGAWRPSGAVRCYLHHHVREYISDLYGFETLEGLELFERLLSVSGIGPKAALAILSIGTIDQIKKAISSQDSAFLSIAPGVGAKAVQKIILELQGKIGLIAEDGKSTLGELVSALEGLGYKSHQVQPLLSQIPADATTLDQQIRWALQKLSGRS
ncbi:Holliday junction branch migration protein RuvA [Patescibacteria group bacterium]|nr:Holliday junction branch migration protein RuvA [Patescibacteria group bacterium]